MTTQRDRLIAYLGGATVIEHLPGAPCNEVSRPDALMRGRGVIDCPACGVRTSLDEDDPRPLVARPARRLTGAEVEAMAAEPPEASTLEEFLAHLDSIRANRQSDVRPAPDYYRDLSGSPLADEERDDEPPEEQEEVDR